jgi:hypothetical protein
VLTVDDARFEILADGTLKLKDAYLSTMRRSRRLPSR